MVGPGILAELAHNAGAAEEGITLEPSTEKNVMQIGADGTGQHSLIADDSGKITIRLLKTSPQNAALMIAYDFQSQSSALWGINTITLIDTARGDVHIAQQVAFTKKPTITQAKEAGTMDWEMQAIQVNSILGGNI